MSDQREPCSCPREGRPDGRGWHLDACRHRMNELDQPHFQRMPCGCPIDSGCTGEHVHGPVALYDLPIFGWAWREDAREVER